jgi:hypothetical protein
MKFTPGDIKNETDLMLLTFDDTVWDQVYDKGLSCQAVRRLFALSLPLRALSLWGRPHPDTVSC